MRSFSKLFCWKSNPSCDNAKRNIVRRHDLVFSKGVITYLAWGVLSLLLGCLSFVWTPRDLILTEIVKMRKSFPTFNWWADPPQQVLLRLHLFNITNHEQFLNGSHTKLHLQEVGPYVFREMISHSNFSWHDNGTLTYTSKRNPVFEPELNNLSLNDTLIVPNVALLGMTSKVSEDVFFFKLALNMFIRVLDSQPVQKMSVYDFLWNNSDRILQMVTNVAPRMVPTDNAGVLNLIYRKFKEDVTVYVGPNNTKRFFTMDQYNGRNRFGYWPDMECDSVKQSTEGILYHQQISKDDKLHFFRKTLCRSVTLDYEKEIVEQGMTAYRFTLPLDVFNKPKDGRHGCYNLPGSKQLPDGLSYISQCFYDVPMVVSFPHFLGSDPAVRNSVVGMEPDVTKHSSTVIVEPVTGIPLESKAGLQCNLLIRDVSGYDKVAPFSNGYIPLFWLQLDQEGLPPHVLNILYFLVVILPTLQVLLSTFMVVLGTSLFAVGVYRFQQKASKFLHDYIPVDTISSSNSIQHNAL